MKLKTLLVLIAPLLAAAKIVKHNKEGTLRASANMKHGSKSKHHMSSPLGTLHDRNPSKICPAETCSTPAYPPVIPSMNGCGPASMEAVRRFGQYELPKDFQCCCDDHDKCYAGCGSDKEQCDRAFGLCLAHACRRTEDSLCDEKRRFAIFFVSETATGCDAHHADQQCSCDCGGPRPEGCAAPPTQAADALVAPPVRVPLAGSECPWLAEETAKPVPVTCVNHKECLPWNAFCDAAAQTCVPLRGVGESCVFDEECGTFSCSTIDKKCQCRPCQKSGCGGCAEGEACYSTSLLTPNTCMALQALLPVGSTCAHSTQCDSGCCSYTLAGANTCEVNSTFRHCLAAPIGASCFSDSDCDSEYCGLTSRICEDSSSRPKV
jgi:hypothetical protein